jgi:DNA (cytosine-5)-methyltransferase 1
VIEEEPTGVSWNSPDATERLLTMMKPLNRAKVDEARRRGGRAIGFLYRRTREGKQRAEIRFDGVSGCLRTPNGGSSRQTVVLVEGGQVRSRLLSPREAARLMGVPDTYCLPESYNEAYWAMGDGVAVPVVRWLSAHLLSPMAEICRLASVGSDGIRGESEPSAHIMELRKSLETTVDEWELSRR